MGMSRQFESGTTRRNAMSQMKHNRRSASLQGSRLAVLAAAAAAIVAILVIVLVRRGRRSEEEPV